MAGRMWSCPNALHPPVRAPEKMRQRDARRFCFECSKEKGVLVERTCGAVARKRERKLEAQRGLKRERAARKARIRSALPRLRKLKSWRLVWNKSTAETIRDVKLRVMFSIEIMEAKEAAKKQGRATWSSDDSRVISVPVTASEKAGQWRVFMALVAIAEKRPARLWSRYQQNEVDQANADARMLGAASEFWPEVAGAKRRIQVAYRLLGPEARDMGAEILRVLEEAVPGL